MRESVDENWNGNIDRIRIWDTALTSTQIQNKYNTTPNTNESNLIAYYTFNEGQGDVLYDYSGNNNHGEIYGAEWIETFIENDHLNVVC